jgi:hypothetical protein
MDHPLFEEFFNGLGEYSKMAYDDGMIGVVMTGGFQGVGRASSIPPAAAQKRVFSKRRLPPIGHQRLRSQ